MLSNEARRAAKGAQACISRLQLLGLWWRRMHYTKSTVHAAEMKAGLETDSGDTVNEMFMTVRKVSTAQKHNLHIAA